MELLVFTIFVSSFKSVLFYILAILSILSVNSGKEVGSSKHLAGADIELFW